MALRGISGRTFFFNRPQGKKPCSPNQDSALTSAIRHDAIGYGDRSSNPGDNALHDAAGVPTVPDVAANVRHPCTSHIRSKPSRPLELARRMLPDNLNTHNWNTSAHALPHTL